MAAGKWGIGEFLEYLGIIHGSVPIGHLNMPPALQRGEHHEQVGPSVALILIIMPSGVSGFTAMGTRVSAMSCLDDLSRQTTGASGSCGLW